MLALYQLSYLALLVAVSLLLCQYLQGWSVRSHSTWIFRIARNAINPSPDSQVQSDQSQGSWSFSDQPLIIHETKQKTVITLSSSGSAVCFLSSRPRHVPPVHRVDNSAIICLFPYQYSFDGSSVLIPLTETWLTNWLISGWLFFRGSGPWKK